MKQWLQMAAFALISMGFSMVESQAQIGPPPMITAQPSGITVQLLGTGTFSANSKRGTTYQWLVNGQPVPTANSIATELPDLLDLSQTVSTLVVLGVTNSGSYTLKVTNLGGSVTSSPAVLNLANVIGTVSNIVNFVASGTGKLANGAFKLTLSVPAGSNIVVQASSDLSNWKSISTNTATSSSMTYTDAAASTISCRFYRAKIQ
jgi:hypothetical protein